MTSYAGKITLKLYSRNSKITWKSGLFCKNVRKLENCIRSVFTLLMDPSKAFDYQSRLATGKI